MMDAHTAAAFRERLSEDVPALLAAGAPSPTPQDVRALIHSCALSIAHAGGVSEADAHQAAEAYFDDYLGYGPLTGPLSDDEVTEVMVNPGGKAPDGTQRPPRIFIERGGTIVPYDERGFDSQERLERIVSSIAISCGRSFSSAQPFLDARTPQGWRVLAVHPRCASGGIALDIRKYRRNMMSPQAMIQARACTPEAMEFLRLCVIAKVNIIVTGGTGSGKTTWLNVLSSFIPSNERVWTAEDPIELQLNIDDIVRCEARPANGEGEGEITIHDIVVASLRGRPDRIIVGEVRDIETAEMIQAMSTGHPGSMSTLHANDPSGALARLRSLVQLSRPNLSERAIDIDIAGAVDLIVHVERDSLGHRHIFSLTAIEGFSESIITRQDIFRRAPDGILRPCGSIPQRISRLVSRRLGYSIPAGLFSQEVLP